jgi:hypothetical protein
MNVYGLTERQLLERIMYWNIERTRLLDARRPLSQRLRSFEQYFGTHYGHRINLTYEENGEKWTVSQRPVRLFISLAQLLSKLGVLGADSDSLGVISAAHSNRLPREQAFMFYSNGVLVQEEYEETIAAEPFTGLLSAAMKQYHQLRKDIVPIKNALSKATFSCSHFAKHLEVQYRLNNPLTTTWRNGVHHLSFAMKSYPLSVLQKEEWMLSHGVSFQDLANWHKYRRNSRSALHYKQFQYWKDDVECTEHWYKGSYE